MKGFLLSAVCLLSVSTALANSVTDFRVCRGVEPFWALDLRSFTFSSPEGSSALQPADPTLLAQGVVRYSTRDRMHRDLELTVRAPTSGRMCTLPMGEGRDEPSAFAVLTIGSEAFEGCCTLN